MTTDKMHYTIYAQIADWLLSLLPPGRPRRLARMLDPGGDKYKDVPRHVPLDRLKLLAHAAGRETWAATLDQDGHSRAGVIEVDQGGRGALLAVLSAAERLGLHCFAIAVDNPLSGHSGGAVSFTYAQSSPIADIRAQLASVVTAAGLPSNTEIWPCAQVIRLPFGYHRWAQTRGELLSQAGELVNLDRDLASGFRLVEQLLTNAAPPAVSTLVDKPKSATTVPIQRVSPGERASGRASLDDVKARFNAEHSLASLLESYGAIQTSAKDFSCPFGCGHSHTNTLYIYNGRLYSRSHNCQIPQKKGLDPFGVYVLIEHNDNVVAAAKELNPIQPRQRQPEAPEPATAHRTAAQVADAARKRAQRLAARNERLARIDPLIDQLDQDSAIYAFARDVFAYHLACWMDGPEHYASIERITRDVLGLDRAPTENEYRRVQLAHKRLIEYHYLKRTIRGSSATKETNCWQPGDGHRVIQPAESVTAQQEGKSDGRITLIESTTDLLRESVIACEGGGMLALSRKRVRRRARGLAVGSRRPQRRRIDRAGA